MQFANAKLSLHVHLEVQGKLIKHILLRPYKKGLFISFDNPTFEIENFVENWFESYLKGNFFPPEKIPLDWDLIPPFSKAVLKAALQIKFGHLATYSDIAKILQKPKSARAVGNSLARNPFALIVPCHRVIPKSGKGLGGFAFGLPVKKALIDYEAPKASHLP